MGAPYPWWEKRWWYPNCCCNNCWIYSDKCQQNWNIPSYWYDQLNSPSTTQWVADPVNTTTGEVGYSVGNGFLICRTEITEDPYNCIVAAKFKWSTTTDEGTARLLCDYVDDDNFHWVSFDYDGSRTGDSIEVKFWDRAAGTDTQIGSTLTVDDGQLTGWPTIYLVLCKSTTRLTLNVFSATGSYGADWPPFATQNSTFFAEAEITDKGGTRAGAGMLGGLLPTALDPDNYGLRLQEFQLERTDAEHSDCETCERFCCSDLTPTEYDLTIAGVADGSACDSCDPDLNGDFTLTLDRTEGTNCRWIYEAGYSSTIYFCSGAATASIDQGITRITLEVRQIGTDPTFNSEWRLRLDGPAYSTHYEVKLTRSNWLGICAFDGTESWTFDTRSNFNCNMSSATFTVTS